MPMNSGKLFMKALGFMVDIVKTARLWDIWHAEFILGGGFIDLQSY